MLSSFYAKNLTCCCHHLLSLSSCHFVIKNIGNGGGKIANILIKKQLYICIGLNDYLQKLNDKMTMTIYDNVGWFKPV